ncbi:MAG: DUF1800 family protein [Solirubrobacteraceae bacterium]|nr:DUF1800 family protein [Patulibacter sp.]
MSTKTKARKAKKSKTLPTCTKKDLRKAKSKRRACVVPATTGRASPSGPVAAPQVTSRAPDAFPTPYVPATEVPVAVLVPAQTGTTQPNPLAISGNDSVADATPTRTSVADEATTPPPAVSTTPSATSADTPASGADALPADVTPTTPSPSTPSPPVATPQEPPINQPEGTAANSTTTDTDQTVSTTAALTSDLVYSGPFGPEQAHRLLFRAACGPAPGQTAALAAMGVQGAVNRLMNPPGVQLVGPAPSGSYLVNGALAPATLWGHTHLQTLDRMVRGQDSIGERMTLILHDWFGVSETGAERQLVSDHIDMLRRLWRGSFRLLLQQVTSDPAMLRFLDGVNNQKIAPNENYAREFMELFTLGADRGAYTEFDVRELARAFTGFCHDGSANYTAANFSFNPARADTGTKTLFAGTNQQRTVTTWREAVNAVVDHPLHASFVVIKLWSYFVPTAPSDDTVQQLISIYRSSGEQLSAVLQAILTHRDVYRGPAMVKPPLVYAAGLLRIRAVGITTGGWCSLLSGAGQLVAYPPNVSGWNDNAWLNATTHASRWACVWQVLSYSVSVDTEYTNGRNSDPEAAVQQALTYWGNPPIQADHLAALRRFAQQTWLGKVPGDVYKTRENFLAKRQNVLRQMVAAAPDSQVS